MAPISLPISLVILAAGLGRRFGGDKQLATVGNTGKPLMYFSVMDAYQAGVRQLVLVINHQIEQALVSQFLPLLPADLTVSLVRQRMDDLPRVCKAGFREKPWGTGHALWSARKDVPAASIVINADDYDGPGAMKRLVSHFENSTDWALVSFRLGNTLSEFGLVNRGLCEESEGFLVSVKECLSIKRFDGVIRGEVDGKPVRLEPGAAVSMNAWGFGLDIFPCLENGLIRFFDRTEDQSEAEFYLPTQVMASIKGGDNRVRVYESSEKWQGIPYRDDDERLSEVFSDTRALP